MIAAAAHFGDVVLLSREEPANQRALFCPPAGTLIKEVRFAGDSPLEQAGFEPSVPARTAVACPPISLDSSSTKTTSGVRASRARFGQLADERIALRYR